MNNPEKFTEILIQSSSENYDLVCYFLMEAGGLGIEDISEGEQDVVIKVFFPCEEEESLRRKIITALSSLTETKILGVEQKETVNWFTERNIHFPPIHMPGNIVVIPEWVDEITDKICVKIRPGMSFGTGRHETTMLSVELISEFSKIRQAVDFIEVGIGSGILSIVAVKLGHKLLTACDIQPECADEVRHNFNISGIDLDTPIYTGETSLIKDQADLLIANMTVKELTPLKDEFIRLTKPGSYFIFSGIDSENLDNFKASFLSEFKIKTHKNLNEWHAFLVQKE